MRTLLLLLVSFILIFFLQECNLENKYEITNSTFTKDTLFNDILSPCPPCCNAGRPHNCLTDPVRSLYVGPYPDGYDICISCECCLDIYNYYGNPDHLNGITIPENIINLVGCDQSKIEH